MSHLIGVFLEHLVLFEQLLVFEFKVYFEIIFASLFHEQSSQVIISTVLAEIFPVIEHLGQSIKSESALITRIGLFLIGVGMQGEE